MLQHLWTSRDELIETYIIHLSSLLPTTAGRLFGTNSFPKPFPFDHYLNIKKQYLNMYSFIVNWTNKNERQWMLLIKSIILVK